MSSLIEFYRGTGTDNMDRTLAQILAYGDADMEWHHDFIQWMFPLREPSQFNPNAPLLTEADIAAFLGDPGLRDQLLKSLDRFLAFLGLERRENEIAPGPEFPARSEILRNPNHNWLRITRVLHCLRLLGLEEQGRRLLDCLEKLHNEGMTRITSDTLRYWRDAARPANH